MGVVNNSESDSRSGQKASIDEAQRDQADVSQVEHILAELLSRVSDAYVALDRDWCYTFLNEQAAALFGRRPEELVGKHIWTEFPEGVGQPFHLNYERAMREQKPIFFEEYYAPWDRWFENRVYPSPDGVSIFFHEVTERHKLEEQLRHAQRMESIGTLAGGIAHDFNNILTAIVGYAEMTLNRMGGEDPLRNYVTHILEASDRAKQLTRDLMIFSRKQASERTPVDLNALVTKTKKFLLRMIREDVECTIEPCAEPLMVLVDSRQFEQALLNLATNARDAMPAGGHLKIFLKQMNLHSEEAATLGLAQAGTYALVSVSDSGVGMDEATRLQIFDPFFTTKEVGKGTGLGLAMVYGIVKQHNGAVTVSSTPGQGTTFQIYLPMIFAAAAETSPLLTAEVPGRGGEIILLAEDDALVRDVASSLLTDYGYTVIEAVDGGDALQKFREEEGRIDLLIFDLIMPKMSGKAAFDAIREINPAIRAVFMTGHAKDAMLQEILSESNTRLLRKPMSPLELLQCVRSLLDCPQT